MLFSQHVRIAHTIECHSDKCQYKLAHHLVMLYSTDNHNVSSNCHQMKSLKILENQMFVRSQFLLYSNAIDEKI